MGMEVGGKEARHVFIFSLLMSKRMRGRLIIPMSCLMPSEMEIILSFNECVLKLHDMSGAKDIMVKKIHMVLTFF